MSHIQEDLKHELDLIGRSELEYQRRCELDELILIATKLPGSLDAPPPG